MLKKTLYDKETEVLQKILNKLPEEEKGAFVWDGFCYGELDCTPEQTPEEIWETSSHKVLILSKEPNGNEGDDYREWDHVRGNGTDIRTFNGIVSRWLYYFNNVKAKSEITPLEKVPSRKEIFTKYPYAHVNIKKTAGGSRVTWPTIWKAAEHNKDELKAQIRRVLKPNIVVCCGSNDSGNEMTKMLSIAIKYIYDDFEFEKINSWCYYGRQKHGHATVLLIDSYHPSCVKSYYDKITRMAEAFQDFLKRNLEI